MRFIAAFLFCCFLPAISLCESSDQPIHIDESVTLPKLIKRVEPKIPDAARGKIRKAGTIILEAVITKKGDVSKVKVLRSVDRLLDQETVAAVKQWKYKPALRKGKPVSVYFTITSFIHVR